jgi:transcriptional regulator with XRE-family HTH domain
MTRRRHFDSTELRAELARRAWRQEDLAAVTGLSRGLIGWLCRGAAPSRRAAKLISIAVGPEATMRIFKSDQE